MEDLYFENESINEKRKMFDLRNIQDCKSYLNYRNGMPTEIKKCYQSFKYVLDIYYRKIYGSTKSYQEILELSDNFLSRLTEEKLYEACNSQEFSQEEKEYIELVQISSAWTEYYDYGFDARYAVSDILFRNELIKCFGVESLSTFRDIIQNELPKKEWNYHILNHYMQLLSDKPYGENVSERLNEMIDKKANDSFNFGINCGGYALKVEEWVNPTRQSNFSQSVSSLLENFPFIRLLGETPLCDDEYLVIYRAPKGENTGHHFIRVDSDGTVREKDANKAPAVFESWGENLNNLDICSEALFAVKKEHKMFGYEKTDGIMMRTYKGLDFEESVNESLKNMQNSFSYHNHDFCLKKTSQGEIFVTTPSGERIAYVIADEDDCLVEVLDGKDEYVENLSGKIKPIIKDGKLMNLNQFMGDNREKKNSGCEK